MNYNQYGENNSSFKHGYTKTRIYNIWVGIKQRCCNIKDKSYSSYGGRGIIMCKNWKNNSKNFINWAYLNGYNDKLVIDRKDNNGNYTPSNCRWVTLEVSNVNKSKQKGTSSKYIGISWNKRDKRWKSWLSINKKNYYLGSFRIEKEALDKRNKFIIDNNLKEHKIQVYDNI